MLCLRGLPAGWGRSGRAGSRDAAMRGEGGRILPTVKGAVDVGRVSTRGGLGARRNSVRAPLGGTSPEAGEAGTMLVEARLAMSARVRATTRNARGAIGIAELNRSTLVRVRARHRGHGVTACNGTLGVIVRPHRGQFRYHTPAPRWQPDSFRHATAWSGEMTRSARPLPRMWTLRLQRLHTPPVGRRRRELILVQTMAGPARCRHQPRSYRTK